MENKQMYVITMSTGSYDSYSSSVVAVTDDWKKGCAYVQKMNDTYNSVKEKVEKFYKNEYVHWQEKNPHPQLKVSRAKKADVDWAENYSNWTKSHKEFLDNSFESLFTKEEMEIYKIYDKNFWEIEEVKNLEEIVSQ